MTVGRDPLHLDILFGRSLAKSLLVKSDWVPPDQVRAVARQNQGLDQGPAPEHRVRGQRVGR
jgi:hypothetical protein